MCISKNLHNFEHETLRPLLKSDNQYYGAIIGKLFNKLSNSILLLKQFNPLSKELQFFHNERQISKSNSFAIICPMKRDFNFVDFSLNSITAYD